MSSFTSHSEQRITLPPIHTLNLPHLGHRADSNVAYDDYDNSRYPTSMTHNSFHGRRPSTSSSHTNATSRASSSPEPSDSESSPDTPKSFSKFRLVSCALEDAEAVILVPPPNSLDASNYTPRVGKGHGLLLMGPALQHVRNPERKLAKGARIHPYRIARGPTSSQSMSSSRRASVISINSFTPV